MVADFNPLPVDPKIFKEECMLCFHTPECPGGIYVCLKTYKGFCQRHLGWWMEKVPQCKAFLHFVRRRVKKAGENGPISDGATKDDGQKEEKITKLAIGVEGGFDSESNQYEFDDRYTLVVAPATDKEIPLTDPSIGADLRAFLDTLIATDGALKLQQLSSLAAAWEAGPAFDTKHTDLKQCDNPPKIPTSGWHCEWLEGCDKKENLWLNLTSGMVLCGRRYHDGSGGNGHALEYFKQTGYPLCVKLGTITAHDADVYSYEEDDMVRDPNLSKHLAHFGINRMEQAKTESTMAELELDLNKKWEWTSIEESGSKLRPLYGPGYTGLVNLGSTCYINSVIQTLCMCPDFEQMYVNRAVEISGRIVNQDSMQDFNLQMMKLICGLNSGDYSPEPPLGSEGETETADYSIIRTEDDELQQQYYKVMSGIRPLQFKALVGKGHPEFSTPKQQDAEEYLRHLLEMIEKNLDPSWPNPVDAIRFKIEERLLDTSCNKVRYGEDGQTILSVPIPMEGAVNREEVKRFEEEMKAKTDEEKKKFSPEQIIRPKVPFELCLEAWSAEEMVADYKSPVTGASTIAQKRLKMGSFPDFLLVQMKRFTVAEDWSPKKLDAEIQIEEGVMDLSFLRAQGIQPGEELLPEDAVEPHSEAPVIDDGVVQQLTDMGFPLEACKKAVLLTNNSGLEAATNWVMEHMGDADFDQPHPSFLKGTKGPAKPRTNLSCEAVNQLTVLGFSNNQARVSLEEAKGNVEQAAEILFTRGADIPAEAPAPMETEPASGSGQAEAGSKVTARDGSGNYKLVGFISHMGSNTSCGHYVCHLLKEGKWVIYNDEKVALSEKPPMGLAYIYLLQRVA